MLQLNVCLKPNSTDEPIFNGIRKMPLLTPLKECVKKIDCEVADLKRLFNLIPIESEETDEDKTSFSFEITHNNKRGIHQLRHDSQKLKSVVRLKNDRIKAYFYDVEDLTLDIEAEVNTLEKHLIKYDYQPLLAQSDEIISTIDQSTADEPTSDSSYNETEVSDDDASGTPKLNISSLEFVQKKSREHGKETAEPVSVVLTPELSLCAQMEGKKPRTAFLSPLPQLNLGGIAGIGSTTKIGDVARRLNF